MSDMPDLSSLFGMLNDKGIDLNNLMQNFSNNSVTSNPQNNDTSSAINDTFKQANTSNDSQKNCSDNNFQMPDMETMMKIIKIMNSLNSNTQNPSTDLLYSLKPFLRDSKKEKVDQYIKFLKMSSIISEINKSGGDFK